MNRQRRRLGGAVLGAVAALFVGLSEQAGAQHTGLFPLAPIRRERVPCQNEDPIYKLYKQQYFGYHPTYWRTFPAGWGVKSEQAPNREKSFAERGLDQPLNPAEPVDEGFNDGGAEGPREMAPGRNEPLEPLVPEGARSPFEMDDTPPAATPRDGAAPRATPPTDRRSPFEDLDQGAAPPSRNGVPGPPAASGTPDAADAPELTAPGAPVTGAVGAYEDEQIEPGADQPLLAVDDLDVSRASRDAAEFDARAAQASAPAAIAAPPAAPRRRLLGGLFDSLNSKLNWLRR